MSRFWRRSGTGVSLARATTSRKPGAWRSRGVKNLPPPLKVWVQFPSSTSCPPQGTTLSPAPTRLPPLPKTPPDTPCTYDRVGGVCIALPRPRAPTKKIYYFSHRRARANTQPRQPLLVMGAARASTGTSDTSQLTCPSFPVASHRAVEAIQLSALIFREINRRAVATRWPLQPPPTNQSLQHLHAAIYN